MTFALSPGLTEKLQLTPQSSHWHGEGDVLTHTRLVVDALHSLPEYHALSDRRREILTAAAWLHDIGKIPQTRPVGDDFDAPNHAGIGSRMAREELWLNHGLCGTTERMQMREAIALLVRYHSFPPHAIDHPESRLRLHQIASCALLVPDFSVEMLCILSRADMLGRICPDKEEMLCRIALCEELAREEGCYDAPYPFPSPLTRRAFLSGADVWKDQEIYDDTWGEVTLMCALPGTGKDTWISQNLPDLPMVSLDGLRRQHKISPTSNQGFVANLAKEQARKLLRQHQPFVWNATCLTTDMRRSLISLFESYKARVHIVYLETDWQTQLQRNSSRPEQVPPAVITAMLGKLTPPLPFEARTVTRLPI